MNYYRSTQLINRKREKQAYLHETEKRLIFIAWGVVIGLLILRAF